MKSSDNDKNKCGTNGETIGNEPLSLSLALFSCSLARAAQPSLTHSQYFSARRHEGILTSILGQMRSVACLPRASDLGIPPVLSHLSRSIFLHVNQEIAFRAIEASARAAYF